MGWFKRDGGRHSVGHSPYGVPDVTARLAAVAARQAAVRASDQPTQPTPTDRSAPLAVVPAPSVLELPVPAPSVPALPPLPMPLPRLPDDRTTEQIGEKVADVLWSYYGQQPAARTALVPASPMGLQIETYDDDYDSVLLDFPEFAPPAAPAAPAAVSTVVVVPQPPKFRVFERTRVLLEPDEVAALPPVALITTPVAAPVLPVAMPLASPVLPTAPPVTVPSDGVPATAAAPHGTRGTARKTLSFGTAAAVEPRRSGVQLGFIDGSTLDLPGDDPAAKALRAAADALTLRD